MSSQLHSWLWCLAFLAEVLNHRANRKPSIILIKAYITEWSGSGFSCSVCCVAVSRPSVELWADCVLQPSVAEVDVELPSNHQMSLSCWITHNAQRHKAAVYMCYIRNYIYMHWIDKAHNGQHAAIVSSSTHRGVVPMGARSLWRTTVFLHLKNILCDI